MQESAQANQPAITKLGGILFCQTDAVKRRNFYITLAAIIVVVCIWIGLRPPSIAFPLDDAYITLHNAEVLRSGSDRNYPGAPALFGATSSIHLALVTGFIAALPPETASFVVGALAILLYSLGLARLAFKTGASPVLAALIVGIGTLSGYGLHHLFNGLETGLAMAAGTWALVFALSDTPSWRLPVLCGLMPFIRPEFAALSALLMGRQTWLRWQQRPAIPTIALDGVLVVLAALPWLLWIRWDTGQFLPATVSAKAVFFAEGGLPPAIKLGRILSSINIMTLVTAFLGFVLIPRNTLAFVALGFFITFMGAYYVQLPGGLHHNYFRYLQILAPFSIFAMLTGARHRPIAQYLLIFAALLVAWTLPLSWTTYVDANAHTRHELAGVASWANANLPSDARILVHDAGYFAYATRFELVDMVGLKTPSIIQFHKRLTAPTNGEKRDEAIHQIAVHFHPTHAVILNDGGMFWGKSADSLKSYGWNLQVLRPAPTIGDYAVFKLTPPNQHPSP